jgi:hypothetical protein
VGDGVWVKVAVGVKVRVDVNVRVGVKLGVNVAVGVTVRVGVNVRVGVRLGVKVVVGVRVIVGVKVDVMDAVGVAVSGGPLYSTSMERKSTYPPDADKDHERQPAGTARIMLTKPGRVVDALYKFHDRLAEQARSVAVPTLPSRVKPTIASK